MFDPPGGSVEEWESALSAISTDSELSSEENPKVEDAPVIRKCLFWIVKKQRPIKDPARSIKKGDP